MAATAINGWIAHRHSQGANVDRGWSKTQGEFYVVRNGEGTAVELIAEEAGAACVYRLGAVDSHTPDADLFRHVIQSEWLVQ